MEILERGAAVSDLIKALWQECPEEAKEMWLPELPNESDSLQGYASADALGQLHGITRQRLSEAKRAGKVQFKPAPAMMKDGDGRTIRVLYHIEDAKKCCQPKHLKKKLQRHSGAIRN